MNKTVLRYNQCVNDHLLPFLTTAQGFAALSDIAINGYTFATILLPLIVVAYESIQKQSAGNS